MKRLLLGVAIVVCCCGCSIEVDYSEDRYPYAVQALKEENGEYLGRHFVRNGLVHVAVFNTYDEARAECDRLNARRDNGGQAEGE